GLRPGGGETCQHGEFIDQISHGLDGVINSVRATADHFERSRVGSGAARQMAMNAFRGKGDRSKRILDLMRHPPRHLAPGCLLLRAQQVRQIFEYENVSQTWGRMFESGYRCGEVELGMGQ